MEGMEGMKGTVLANSNNFRAMRIERRKSSSGSSLRSGLRLDSGLGMAFRVEIGVNNGAMKRLAESRGGMGKGFMNEDENEGDMVKYGGSDSDSESESSFVAATRQPVTGLQRTTEDTYGRLEKKLYGRRRKGGVHLPEEPLAGSDCYHPNEFGTIPDGLSFKALLKRYQMTRAQVRSWSDFYTARNGGRPTMKQVDSTELPWLKLKFREYVDVKAELEHMAKTENQLIEFQEVQLLFGGVPTPSAKILPVENRVEMDFVDEWIDNSYYSDLSGADQKSSSRDIVKNGSSLLGSECKGQSPRKHVRLERLDCDKSSKEGLPSGSNGAPRRVLSTARGGSRLRNDKLEEQPNSDDFVDKRKRLPGGRGRGSSIRSYATQQGFLQQFYLLQDGLLAFQRKSQLLQKTECDFGENRESRMLVEALEKCWHSLLRIGVALSGSLLLLYIFLYWAYVDARKRPSHVLL